MKIKKCHPYFSDFSGEKFRQTAVLSLLLILLAYLPALDYGFFVDDDVYVGHRNYVLHGLELPDLWRLLVMRGNNWEFLPVRDFTYWLDIQFFGGWPEGFHAANIAWYVVCLYAVFRFVTEIFRLYTDERDEHIKSLSALAAVIFFSHPAHVEAVVWISGRKDILATTFSVFGACCFFAGMRKSWSLSHLAWSVLLFILSLFSKSVAVFFVAPLALFAVNVNRWRPSEKKWRFWLYFSLPVIVSACALCIHIRVGMETGIGVGNTLGFFDVLDRASRILTALVGIVFLPYDLRLIYDVFELGLWHWSVSGAIFASICWAMWALFLGKRCLIAVGLFLTLVPLFPYLQFFPYITWSLASERFVFPASVGFVVFAAAMFRSASPNKMLFAALLVSLFFVSLLAPRVRDWESALRLRLHDVHASSGNHNVVREYVIGHLLPERRFIEARRISEGIYDRDLRGLMLRTVDASEKYYLAIFKK